MINIINIIKLMCKPNHLIFSIIHYILLMLIQLKLSILMIFLMYYMNLKFKITKILKNQNHNLNQRHTYINYIKGLLLIYFMFLLFYLLIIL